MAEANQEAMRAFKAFNENLIKEFRANGGKAVSGPFVNAPLLLITTTGAKSGRPFTTPLVYTKDGDRIVIIASKGGAPASPDWYFNLKANPIVALEVGTEKFQAKAVITIGRKRRRAALSAASEML